MDILCASPSINGAAVFHHPHAHHDHHGHHHHGHGSGGGGGGAPRRHSSFNGSKDPDGPNGSEDLEFLGVLTKRGLLTVLAASWRHELSGPGAGYTPGRSRNRQNRRQRPTADSPLALVLKKMARRFADTNVLEALAADNRLG